MHGGTLGTSGGLACQVPLGKGTASLHQVCNTMLWVVSAIKCCAASRHRSPTGAFCFAAEKAMTIAADVCIYTNHNFTTEALRSEVPKEQPSKLLAGH